MQTSKEIARALESFAGALPHLSYKTHLNYRKYLKLYFEWLQDENISAGQARATDILSFTDSLRSHYSPAALYRAVHAVKTWYTTTGYKRNPALGIKIRHRTSKVPHNLLERKTLEKIYRDYECTTSHSYRDKVIIGLLVFQGLSTGDLKRLKTTDVDLHAGKLHVPGGRHINSRILTLEACQILGMKIWLEDIRPQFLKAPTDQLLLNRRGKNMQNVINMILSNLREQYPDIRNAGHIRQSVISEWLKEKDVRIVQYMAGHKKVKSTERYQSGHLEDLQEQLNRFHPLG